MKGLLLFRDYGSIAELARKSAESSGNAIAAARKHISNVEDVLEIRIDELGERIKDFDDKFGSFPMNSQSPEEIAKDQITIFRGCTGI